MGKEKTPPVEVIEVSSELLSVRRKRYKEARRAGLTIVESQMFASAEDLDVGVLRHLVRKGCPPDAIARILL